jgi:hypothetical protein
MVARTLARGKVAIVAMLVYFAPSIVADRRGRRNVLLLALMNAAKRPLSNLEWVDCWVKCGRKPGEANT